ncbi:hypothetical protein [Massilia phyllosphaerae]|uniref:hypothetical protein n=1 Tax=Massilia phyllosphaerae TaxID=3106034 RepID=UPI002B1CB4BB|nr:hypothetical protein [Massilia sp. SGZ-792]
MKSVEFLKPWKIYSPGDVAGFEAEQAKRLVDGGVAKEVAAEEKPAEEKPAKPAK